MRARLALLFSRMRGRTLEDEIFDFLSKTCHYLTKAAMVSAAVKARREPTTTEILDEIAALAEIAATAVRQGGATELRQTLNKFARNLS